MARTLKTLAGVGILALGTTLLSTNAQAQFFGGVFAERFSYGAPEVDGPPGVLGPADIRQVAQEEGYRLSGPPRRNGRVYTAEAVDRRGAPLRLIIDAYEGEILRVFPLRPPANIGRSQAGLAPSREIDPMVVPGVGGEPLGEPAMRPLPKPKSQAIRRELGPDGRAPRSQTVPQRQARPKASDAMKPPVAGGRKPAVPNGVTPIEAKAPTQELPRAVVPPVVPAVPANSAVLPAAPVSPPAVEAKAPAVPEMPSLPPAANSAHEAPVIIPSPAEAK